MPRIARRPIRTRGLTPHVAAKRQFSAIDRRTMRHRGGERVDWMFTFAATAYNLVRLRTLEAAA